MPRKKRKVSTGNRAAGYIRVSDESQVQGYSLDAQRTEIARWCERNGYQLVQVYADEGVSAHNDKIEKRPQLARLIEDVRIGNFDIVVVHTLDRWARNIGVQRLAISKLGECDVGFTSVTEDFDYSSPSGRFLLTTLGGASELSSDLLAIHVRKSQRRRAELGLPIGPVPFGYRTIEPGRVPQVEQREGTAVREVYERRAEGESTGAIAAWLNQQELRTIRGGMFTAHAIKDMLNCRFYLGIIEHDDNEYPGQHKPIITEELFQRAQAKKMTRTITRSVVGPKGLLQGMISCGQCGRGVQSDRHRYGGAMYRERHSHECVTNGRSIMAKGVDEQVKAILTSVELLPEWRAQMARLAVANRKGPDPKYLKEKRRRLHQVYINEHSEMSYAEYEA
jgi:site-specific DNA recombinase